MAHGPRQTWLPRWLDIGLREVGKVAAYREIHRNPMMVSRVGGEPALQMTDYFFLVCLFIMLFWALDPFRVSLDNIGFVKRIPSVLIVINLAFIAVSRLMFAKRSEYVSVLTIAKDCKWLLLFAFMVIGGSAYARFVSKIEETFLTMGTYTLFAPIIYWYVVNSNAPMRLLRAIAYMMVLWSLIAAGLQFAFFRKLEAFHAREHLVLPILGVFFYCIPWKHGKWVAVLLLPAVAVAASKNTAFLLVLVTLGYLLGLSLWDRLSHHRDGVLRFTTVFGVIVLSATLVAGLGALRYKFKEELPTGNPEYRLVTYKIAWNKFLSSPVWGSGFRHAAVEQFDRFEVAARTQNLPTHSDPLDMLANGGVLGFGFWLAGVGPLLWRAFWRYSRRVKELVWQDQMVHHGFLIMSLSGVLVCIFNPIYNLPSLAMATWLQFACLLASYRLITRKLDGRKGKV